MEEKQKSNQNTNKENPFEDLSSFTSRKEYKISKKAQEGKRKAIQVIGIVLCTLIILCGMFTVWAGKITENDPTGSVLGDIKLAISTLDISEKG